LRSHGVPNQDEVDFVWLLGDISYADDALLHTPFKFRYEEVYNGYMTWLQPLIANKPFQVRAGKYIIVYEPLSVTPLLVSITSMSV
jgi:hypothetical protein